MKISPDRFADDCLERFEFSRSLENFLCEDHQYVDGALVVSLEASFGDGKTTFIRMWASDLRERRENDESASFPVVLNAWEADYCGDPLLSIVESLSQIGKENVSKNVSQGLKRAIQGVNDLAKFGFDIATQAASSISGIDWEKAVENDSARKQKRADPNFQVLDIFRKRASALQEVKSGLRIAFGDASVKAIVFVDELDRCSPEYAISYLETIKHIFDVKGITFILAVDPEQLRAIVSHRYGPGIKFREYYRKFAHRIVSLPTIGTQARANLVDHYIAIFLNSESGRRCSIPISGHRDDLIQISSALSLNPRQLQEAFRILGYLAATEKDEKLLSGYSSIAILLSFLKVANESRFHELGRTQLDFSGLASFFRDELNIKNWEWWFFVYVRGMGEDIDFGQLETSCNKFNLRTSETIERQLMSYSSVWGHSHGSGILRSYQVIESVSKIFV